MRNPVLNAPKNGESTVSVRLKQLLTVTALSIVYEVMNYNNLALNVWEADSRNVYINIYNSYMHDMLISGNGIVSI